MQSDIEIVHNMHEHGDGRVAWCRLAGAPTAALRGTIASAKAQYAGRRVRAGQLARGASATPPLTAGQAKAAINA